MALTEEEKMLCLARPCLKQNSEKRYGLETATYDRWNGDKQDKDRLKLRRRIANGIATYVPLLVLLVFQARQAAWPLIHWKINAAWLKTEETLCS